MFKPSIISKNLLSLNMHTLNTPYIIGNQGWVQLNSLVEMHLANGVFILADSNTEKYCVPILKANCEAVADAKLIVVPAGENTKTIETVQHLWGELLKLKSSRSSLLICVGGGMLTDLGGFVAATYKRGMDFVLLPTTLLGMVDASIGGKTALNFAGLKNQVGLFAQANAVFVFSEFLKTLPRNQKLSGYAEMIKHGMIDNESHFQQLIIKNSPEKVCFDDMIMKSAQVKLNIVQHDAREQGVRKALNFGHTIGHAFEAYSQKVDTKPLLHGDAVAIGLLCESFISMRYTGFNESDLKKLANLLSWHFPHYKINSSTSTELIDLMSYDKKNNSSTQINFSLLKRIGEVEINQLPDLRLIRESLHFYMNLENGFFL